MLFNINCSRILFGSPPSVLEIETKTKEWELIKLSFFAAKEAINNEKTALRMGENNCK